jgi:hypothetical protein
MRVGGPLRRVLGFSVVAVFWMGALLLLMSDEDLSLLAVVGGIYGWWVGLVGV